MIKKPKSHFALFTILFITLSSITTVLAQEENHPFGEKKKIHLLAVVLKPNDTFIESQVTKSALRTLYETGQYHIIVGDRLAYKKIVIGVETLAIYAKRVRDKYQITITLREQRKGKILRRLRATNVLKNNFLSKTEDLLSKLFKTREYKKDSTIIIDQRDKKKLKVRSGGLKIVDKNNAGGAINSNVVVLSPSEIIKKREDVEAYYREKAKRNKEKQWGEEKRDGKQTTVVIPKDVIAEEVPIAYKKVKDVERVATKVKPPVVVPPEVIPPLPPAKPPRKPIPMRIGVVLDYESLNTDDLLTDVNTSIMRYGISFEPRIWTLTENSFFVAGGQLITRGKKVIFRDLEKRLNDEWKVHAGYRQFLFSKHLELDASFNYGIHNWANLGEPFLGIQTGELRLLDLRLGLAVNFNLFKKKHGLGLEYSVPITESIKYTTSSLTAASTSYYKAFYDYHMGEGTRIRAGYSNRKLRLAERQAFSYSSTVFSIEMIMDMSF